MNARFVGFLGLLLGVGIHVTTAIGAPPAKKPDWNEVLKTCAADQKRAHGLPGSILVRLEDLLRAPEAQIETKIEAANLVAEVGRGRRHDFAPEVLYPLLKDARLDARLVAVDALWSLDSYEAIPALLPLLQDEEADARCRVAQCLGSFKGRARLAVPALVAALRDKDPRVVRCSTEVLGEIGAAAHEAIPALIERAKNPEDSSAIRALGQIGPAGPNGRKAVDFLRERIVGSDLGDRGAAAVALGAMVPEVTDLIPEIVQVYEAKNVKDPEAADRLKTSALVALGSMGAAAARANPKVVPLLAEVLKDRNVSREVRGYAAQALMHMGRDAKSALPTLREIAEGDELVVREQAAAAIRWIQE